MKRISFSTPATIHLFAIAHATIAVLSRLVDYMDDVPLTVLTILMIVIIAIRQRMQTEITAMLTLVGTFSGYLLGTYGATIVSSVVSDPTTSSAITTAIVTELLGWSVYGISSLKSLRSMHANTWSPSIPQLALVAAAILLLRVSYSLIFNSSYFSQSSIYPEFNRMVSNTFAMVVLVCGNVILVGFGRLPKRLQELQNVLNVILIALFSVAITFIVYYDLPNGGQYIFAGLPFLRQYAVVLLADMVVYAGFTLIGHLYTSQDELRTERGKKHLAQFQYNKLKMQINPHFLFNSLNILDYLVQEGQTERASAFIRKLADSYRYMLKTEDEPLVTLQEEIDFAHKYSELLQERFASGFTVHYQIDDQLLNRSIIPCCLQLLIENATKHNIVSPERPLTIFVCAEGDTLTVRNNIQPRITAQASTGTGLKNIRQQYLDICNRPISVEKTQSEFIVNIPLL